LANAIAIHAQFHDDSDLSSWTHPGSLIISVAASLGEAADAPLDLVLRGIVAGYDALGWLGAEERLARAMIGRGVRTSPTLGAIGAAATAAVILRLDEEAAVNAIGISSSIAGGVLEPVKVGSDEWRVQNGHAASGGLLAAHLAARGVVGAASGLEGSKGLAHSLGGLDVVPEWDSDPRVDAILEIVAKPWATLGDNMAAAIAAKLLHEDGLDLGRVRAVRVRIWRPYAEYPGTAYRGPFHHTAQALASTVFATSAMLVTGDLEYEVSRDQRENSEILRLAALTTVEGDDGGGPTDGSIEISLDDGSVRRRTSNEAPRTLLYHDRSTAAAVFESRLRRCGRPIGQGESLAKSILGTIDSASSVDFKFFLDRFMANE
jgi:2-methylcitrate dehydratase PrpD